MAFPHLGIFLYVWFRERRNNMNTLDFSSYRDTHHGIMMSMIRESWLGCIMMYSTHKMIIQYLRDYFFLPLYFTKMGIHRGFCRPSIVPSKMDSFWSENPDRASKFRPFFLLLPLIVYILYYFYLFMYLFIRFYFFIYSFRYSDSKKNTNSNAKIISTLR